MGPAGNNEFRLFIFEKCIIYPKSWETSNIPEGQNSLITLNEIHLLLNGYSKLDNFCIFRKIMKTSLTIFFVLCNNKYKIDNNYITFYYYEYNNRWEFQQHCIGLYTAFDC